MKVAEVNHFPHTPHKGSYRWNKMVLQVHEKSPTTNSEIATDPEQQSGQSK